MTGTRLRFRFQAAGDMPESEAKSDDYRRWAVRITDADSAKRFDRTFIVPVFRTGGVASTAWLADSHETLVDVPAQNIATGPIEIARTAYGIEIEFGAFRYWTSKLALGVIGLIGLGVAVASGMGMSGLSFSVASVIGGTFAFIILGRVRFGRAVAHRDVHLGTRQRADHSRDARGAEHRTPAFRRGDPAPQHVGVGAQEIAMECQYARRAWRWLDQISASDRS